MKVGVFGGTFDPIHVGHLIVAEEARGRLGLDEVLFVPAGQPWFKAGDGVTEARHRMAMVELAIASNPCFRASDIEIGRAGPTYTVETLIELREQLGPDSEIYLILGLDSLQEIDRWRSPERVFELATVVGMSRPGCADLDAKRLDSIFPGASDRVMMLDGPLIDISATDLRRRVSEGLSIKYRVPESVEAYIYEHGLYR
ncbi:MAG: nicotinate-nucleotide adenylyltransferase [Chloroflexi bacterium]|nr:nicotinate-nucleotide adenylyltransferase [Chloroflexota bacterium]